MQVLIIVSLIILWLIFGSFGSVIFFRLGDLPTWKTLKGFIFGRSECRKCHHTLHTSDLIPLRSFFSQGGKCRYCKTKLSRRYPTLELWTVLIFLAVYFVMFSDAVLMHPYAIFWLLALGVRLLFLIFLYDLKEYELHLTASILLLLLSLLGQRGFGYNLRPALQGMFIFFLVFLLIYYGAKRYVAWRYKEKAEGFGFGDVLLAGILGTIFPIFITLSSPLERIYLLCTYLILSCVLGLVLYAVLVLFHQSFQAKNITMSKRTVIIPFLPAMILAFLIFTLYGNQIISLLLPF